MGKSYFIFQSAASHLTVENEKASHKVEKIFAIQVTLKELMSQVCKEL